MIGKLKGKVAEIEENRALIETESGVFYEVLFTPSLLGKFRVQSLIEIFTYLQVREDALLLFGFEQKEELNFFKMLLSVPGIGPKTAYSIISFSKIADLIDSVKKHDADYLSQIPGLGRKTALKVILELSNKFEKEFDFSGVYLTPDDKTVVEALVALGMMRRESISLVRKTSNKLSVEERVKKALLLASSAAK